MVVGTHAVIAHGGLYACVFDREGNIRGVDLALAGLDVLQRLTKSWRPKTAAGST